MSHVLYRLGRFAARHPWRVVGAWLTVAIAVVGASSSYGRELDDSVAVPGLDSQEALELLSSAGVDDAGLTAYVVATPLDGELTFFEPSAARADLAELRSAIAALPNVLDATDPAGALAEGRDVAVAGGSVSPDGRVALVRVQYPVREELARADFERLEDVGAQARIDSELQIEMGGDLFFEFAQPETSTAEMIGLLAAVLILFFAFGSLIAMGLPIGMAILGLALSISSMSLLAYIVDVPTWATQMGVMIGLGVGIDYALFLVTRHREFLAQGMTVSEAAGRSVATAGQAVVFAGGTVVIAILGLAVAGIPFVTNGGIAIAVIVLTMVIASITLLPAFLGLAGHRIERLRLRRGYRQRPTSLEGRRSGGSATTSGWQRWGGHVSSHALAYAIGATVLLLALTAPILSLRLGFPDEGTLPESRTERRAYDLVAAGFGPGTNSPLIIAVDTAGDPDVLEPLAEAIAADGGIEGVAPPVLDADSGVATLLAFPTTSPQDEATLDTIGRIRSEVFGSVLAGSPAEAHVGGATATWSDLGERVEARLPLFIAAVLVLSFLLLMVVFRSILVPLKAALLNVLSIGAAYGVMVMVFQWGWGMGLIGLEATAPVIPFIPMFMFAIVFGLSMDYEVFLLSRVREEYLATGDNDGSVIHGIASTARVITSAALIMISVFLAFALGDDPSIKMFGIGLATAVFVDATIVRMVLVPATMKLMGDANWWFPSWLDRIVPAIDIDGGAGLPEPEMEPADSPDDAPSDAPAPDRERALV
jgi:putative drug exporter of the RND superfamily